MSGPNFYEYPYKISKQDEWSEDRGPKRKSSDTTRTIFSFSRSRRRLISTLFARHLARPHHRYRYLSIDLKPFVLSLSRTLSRVSSLFDSNMDAVLRTEHSPFLCMYDLVEYAPTPAAGRAAASVAERGDQEELKKGIAELYDESSEIWERLWGDHMHHGFYDKDASVSLSDHRLAQVRMVEEALAFAGITDDPLKKPKRIVDIGCGIGGSSRYLAKKYGAKCEGITLSPVQAKRAQALAVAEGLEDQVSFQVADALKQPFPDGQFDLVWAMESGEHMPDKTKFVGELARVAAPGATIIIVTWCHRDLSPSEESLQPDELNLLNKICNSYYLPAWCSASDYVTIARSLSLEDIRTADWSENVAPFWPAVIRSALTWKGFTSLLRSGWKTIRGALAMPLMIEGYKKKLIKFAIIACRKPM